MWMGFTQQFMFARWCMRSYESNNMHVAFDRVKVLPLWEGFCPQAGLKQNLLGDPASPFKATRVFCWWTGVVPQEHLQETLLIDGNNHDFRFRFFMIFPTVTLNHAPSDSPAPSGWLAPLISASLRFLMWALRRKSDAGCVRFHLLFVGFFFWESTKMYSGDEHHFITFDPLSSEKRYIWVRRPFGGQNQRPQRNVWQWMFWISESQKA
jgi:hypothetical protein